MGLHLVGEEPTTHRTIRPGSQAEWSCPLHRQILSQNCDDLDGEHQEIGRDVDPHLVSLSDPSSFEAEQYRALRYVVEVMHKGAGLGVLAVTSPVAGDGKTTTAINLAGSLAQAPETRVLLLCADLRRPSMAEKLGLPRRQTFGLAELILDPRRTLAEAVQHLTQFNISIIPAGSVPAHAYEILKSPRLGDLLAEARTQFDYVILDTAPLVIVPDSRLIGQWVDGFLLVVAAHKTPRKFVAEALNLLDPQKVIGLVFNGDDQPLSSYYGHYEPYMQSHASPRTRWWRRLGQRLGIAEPDRRPSRPEQNPRIGPTDRH